MEAIKIQLAFTWTALMLIYLLGDVLRLGSGDWKSEENGVPLMSKTHFFIASLMMLVPILMIVANVYFAFPLLKWLNMIVAGLFFLLNVGSIHTYPSLYDRFLLVVSLFINILTIWTAYNY